MDSIHDHQAEDYPYDLGTYRFTVNSTSQDAQIWFSRGMVWSYAFNHEEAVSCFEKSVAYDSKCIMAWWGKAYALGPNYNKAWSRFDARDREETATKANAALTRASELAHHASRLEHALVDALLERFPGDNMPEDFECLDHAYVNAMRTVYQSNATDLDIATLFAEALICTRARALWDLDTGKSTGSYTTEACAVLESAMAQEGGKTHLGLCHMYVHLMEMSPFPERALNAADTLRHLVPQGSHLLHMGTHIDIVCGDYRRALISNHDATVADDYYFSLQPEGVFYTMYRAHNLYAKIYAAIMLAHQGEALSAVMHLQDRLTPQTLLIRSPPMADWAESYLGALAHVLIRFGRWDDILSLDLPSDRKLFRSATAMILYARGIALGALGRIEEAEVALRHFETARAAVPDTRLNSLPSKEVDILQVASVILKGEFEYRKGNFDLAFSTLRKAVKLEDSLPYTDTPPWMQPVRHALGSLLLEQNRVGEAEVVYREDLGVSDKLPGRRARINNVWALHGLHESLVRFGKFLRLCSFVLGCVLHWPVPISRSSHPVSADCFARPHRLEEATRDCCTELVLKIITSHPGVLG